MRVLHVAPFVSPKSGGPGNIPGLVRALGAHGLDVTLLTTNAEPDGRLDVPLDRRIVCDGVPSIYCGVSNLAGRWGYAPAMRAILAELTPAVDLVHIHLVFNFACAAAASAAREAGVPFVVQPRGSLDPFIWERNGLLKAAYLSTLGRPLIRDAAAVVFTADEERTRARYPRGPAEWVVPNGIDVSWLDESPNAGAFRSAFPAIGGPFLLFLGRISHQKGLDLLVRAFARIVRERPDLWLVLAGPDCDGLGGALRRLARTLGVEPRVVFTGTLTDALKRAAFVDAELFVLPSRMENFGTAIVEALACGLPVVISDRVHIHRELGASGATTVVACSVDAVAEGIASALGAPDGRRAAAARSFVRSRYTWDRVVPALVARYGELIRQRSAA